MRRWPLAVIAAWVIVAILAGPLAASLDEVVKTSEEQFLPSTAESVRASEALENLTGGGAGAPPYIIVLHGVNVGYDYYRSHREWYDGLKSEFDGNLTSWIDIVEKVEANVTEGAGKALDGAVKLVEGYTGVWEAYNKTNSSAHGLAQLVLGADKLYAATYAAGVGVEKALPALEGEANATLAACNQVLPGLGKLYYDVVRSEVALETVGAYEHGLDNQTLQAAVNYTAQGPLGPVDPEIVRAVYALVLQAGGPGAFNNTLAAQIAGRLLTQQAGSNLPVNVTIAVWSSIVSGDTDHASIVRNAPSPAEGMGQLLQRVQVLEDEAKKRLPGAIAGAIASQAPQAKPLLEALAAKLNETGCDPQAVDQAIMEAIADFLAGQGLPEPLARAVALDVVEGRWSLEEAANLAAGTVIGQAGVNVSQGLLAQVLLKIDPNATDNLTEAKALAAGAYMAALMAGVPGEEAQTILEADDPVAAAATLILNSTAGPQAVALLQDILSGNLAQRGLTDDEIVELVASKLASKANLSMEDSKLVAREALSVARGEKSRDQAVREIVENWMPGIVDKILDEAKGKLVEKDLQGYIILVWPSGDTMDDRVEAAMQVKEEVAGEHPGAKVLLGGNEYLAYEMRQAALNDIKKSDRVSMIFVVVILTVLMGSIAAMLLPFFSIGMGLVASMAAAYILAKHGLIDVTTHSRTIMFSTGLGLGVDYAAYVVKRFKEQLAETRDPGEAALKAAKLSVRPVASGALAAMIGFGSMMLAWDFPFIKSIGTDVPLTIAAVAVASLTLVPAILALVGGRKGFWWPGKTVHGGRILASIAAHRASTVIAALLVVIAVAGLYGFQGSYDLAAGLPPSSEARQAVDMLTQYYDPGVMYPVTIVASNPDKAQAIADTVGKLDCVSSTEVDGRIVNVYLSVYPLEKQGIDCTKKIREEAHRVDPGSLVGGVPAVELDLHEYINRAFYHKVYPAAIILMIITLMVAYGGALVAVAAILGVVIAAYAASAITVQVYQNILGMKVPWYLPVIVFTAILGVGMDYNSFYLASAREACSRRCSPDSVLDATEHVAGLVLGLATIMAGAYVGLALAETPTISIMGTALALGVLLAAVNAALILTPQIIMALQARSWWPSKPWKR